MAKQKKLTATNATFENWVNSREPFDSMTCSVCLSQHADGLCDLKEHAEVTSAAKKWRLNINLTDKGIKKNLPVFVRLRKRFAKFYPKDTSNA
jgi:hypothetical protein